MALAGTALSPKRRSKRAVRTLRQLLSEADTDKDLALWRRVKAMLGYIDGKRVICMAEELETSRGSINRWLQWYEAVGADGLRTKPKPGAAPKLDKAQREELTAIIECGPQAAGYSTGIWTGPMIGELIRKRYGVSYHNHHVPKLLHRLGFSVQRPRKRLARADAEKQAVWLKKRFPAIKKSAPMSGRSAVRR